MQIVLDRNSAQPLYEQLAHDIQQRIRAGALPSGTRLPTVRELARQLGITRLTVHSAYSELQSNGWVEATVGRGTFVAPQPAPAMLAPELGREVSGPGVLSDILRMTQLPGMRSLAMADPAPEFYPTREFERALSEALANGGNAMLAYMSPQGDIVLRTVLAELLRERGLSVGPDEIVITSGVSQAMTLVTQTLARAGDCVIVEQPTYLGLLNILTTAGVRPIGIPVDEDGLVTDELEALILAHRPRFIYTIPVFQNPSGACLSPARRAALLAIAARHRIPVVEDDIYSQLVYEGSAPPALLAEDRSGNVLHLGSFSKSLLPGLRMGYIVAGPPMVGRMATAKQSADLCCSPLLQRSLAVFIQHGWMAAHLRRTLPRYRERRDALLAALERYFPSGLRWTNPRGGFSTWVTLPVGISATELYLAAIEQGVAFAPGDVFFSGPAPRPYMRLSFGTQPPAMIAEVIAILGDLLRAQLGRRSNAASCVADYVPLV